jgi:hypothetical protein
MEHTNFGGGLLHIFFLVKILTPPKNLVKIFLAISRIKKTIQTLFSSRRRYPLFFPPFRKSQANAFPVLIENPYLLHVKFKNFNLQVQREFLS